MNRRRGASKAQKVTREKNLASVNHGGRQTPYCSELKREGKQMKTVESLLTKHVAVEGRRGEIAQWLEVEFGGPGKLCIILLESRESLVQRKLKRHDN